MTRWPFLKALLLCAGLAATVPALAETVVLEASKDSTLCEDAAGSLGNGAGQYLFAGRTDQNPGEALRRGLVAFDIASQVPAGSTITSVSLTLNMSRSIAGPEPVALHRVSMDWGEGTSDPGGQEGRCAAAGGGDATWLHTFFDTGSWATSGGDFAATASAGLTVGDVGPYSWGSTPELVADVQAWLDDPSTNFGWMLVGNESSAASAKRFDSRQSSSPDLRPSLTVDFTPPAGNMVVLEAAKDNTLCEDAGGSLSNGAGQYFFAGLTDQDPAQALRRGLLAFDIASQVPAGSTITSVSLTLHMSRTIAGPEPVALHRVLRDWGEGTSDAGGQEGRCAAATTDDATWLHTFFDTDNWGTSGGDFLPTESATQMVADAGPYTWASTPDLVADVQAWLDDPSSNFGWMVVGNESSAASAKRFNSRQNPVPDERPSLTVEFTPGGAGPTVYESADAATVLSSPVGPATPSPHQHTPAPDPELYYQLDDGAGSPTLIEMVKGDAGTLLIYYQ